MISNLVQNGLSDIDNQYFILLFNFNPSDFSNIYLVFGAGTLVVQVRSNSVLKQLTTRFWNAVNRYIILFIKPINNVQGDLQYLCFQN